MMVTRASSMILVVRPDGGIAVISCDRSRQIAGINLHNWKLKKKIGVGPECDGMVWAAR